MLQQPQLWFKQLQVVLAIGELLEEREAGWIVEWFTNEECHNPEFPKSEAGKTNEINERMLNPVIKKIKPEEMQRSFGGGF